MMLEPLVLTSVETWRWRRLKNLIPGRRRWNTKRSRHRHLLDDVPASFKKAKTVHMAARRKSEKGKAKQLEKELPWGQIPPQESHFYVAAARRQPVGRAPDAPVLNTVDPERVLSSRFAYKDKNHNRRKHDSTLPCRPKATLCVAGQHDPDLGRMDTWQQRRLPRGRVGRKPSRSGRSRATRTTPRQPGAAGADQESRTTIGSVSWLANLR